MLEAKSRHDLLEVRPDFALFRDELLTVAFETEQIGGMERRHDRYPLVVQPFAACGRDAAAVHEEVEGDGAEQDDGLRLDEFDLPLQIGQAGGAFLRLRIAVAWRTAFDDVRDIAAALCVLRRAVEPHGVDHAGEQLACASDEGNALPIFVFARAFADEHDAGLSETVLHDIVFLAGIERTCLAGKDGLRQLLPIQTGGRSRRLDF